MFVDIRSPHLRIVNMDIYASQTVFDMYDIVIIIFNNLPYYYVSAFRPINMVCNNVGKHLYDIKWKADVEHPAYTLLQDVENMPLSTMNWEIIHRHFDNFVFIITNNLYPILLHDLPFLERFIFQCIYFQHYYGHPWIPKIMNIKNKPWWNVFRKMFKKYCWIDYPELHLKQVAQLKGLSKYINSNRSQLVKKLKRSAHTSYFNKEPHFLIT